MKALLASLAISLLLSHYCYADDYPSLQWTYKREFNFRKTRWGMTMSQVKKSEVDSSWIKVKNPPDPNSLVYGGKLFGHSCLLIYFFEKGRLTTGAYSIPRSKSLKPLIEATLIKKYGKPFVVTAAKTYWSVEIDKTLITLWTEGQDVSVHYAKFDMHKNRDVFKQMLLMERKDENAF